LKHIISRDGVTGSLVRAFGYSPDWLPGYAPLGAGNSNQTRGYPIPRDSLESGNRATIARRWRGQTNRRAKPFGYFATKASPLTLSAATLF